MHPKYLFICISLLMITNSYSQAVKNKKEISRKDSIKLTLEIQNKSFVFDENRGDIDSSIFYAELALMNWIALRDTVNEANNRKYLGYLYGKKGHYEKGKSEIFKAISLYKTKKHEHGIAVSYFDLSKVYGYENRYDSSILYIDKAIDFWLQKADTFRILTNYNQKLNVLLLSKQFDNAMQVHSESNKLLGSKNLHWRPKLDFYYLSMKYFDEIKYIIQEKYYEQLYTDLRKNLKKKGIKVISNY